VLLHAGVADRRGWRDVAGRLPGTVVSYDRRGFGDTPPSPGSFSHLRDLLAVLRAVVPGRRAWLVGSSMGGALALDAALEAPELVEGLVLLAPAVSGAPEPGPEDLDPATLRLAERLEAAGTAGDLDELARVEAWLWLDGPASPEGRVAGEARELALAMNAAALAHGAGEDAGASGVDAWARLHDVRAPTTVAWGELDVPAVIELSEAVAARVPGARTHVLEGCAHLPMLERPAEVAALVTGALAG
jgi:pimeloyl-ACP methyl ester carboxylesterase